MKKIIGFLFVLSVTAAPVFAVSGIAEVKGTAAGSSIAGTVTFDEAAGGLQVRAMLTGLPPGQHAFHIHEFGSCADAGKAAGSHYNPMSAPHGHILKDGVGHAHAGDMGNLEVGKDGKASMQILIPGVTLVSSSVSVAGRAVIVHEKVDDFSQPVGNAGGRIACAPIVLIGK